MSAEGHASAISTTQLLRAVAALSVFAFHLADSLAADFGVGAGNMVRIGANGVDIFFVISGFIICFATRNDQSVAVFAIKRSVRILPLY